LIRGASARRVVRAIETGATLPGTNGFGGELPDGTLVSDVLGRVPVFVSGDEWAFDPGELTDPERFPAGHVRDENGERRRWGVPAPPALPPRVARVRLRRALDATLGALDSEDLAVAFSGGVDSALVASATDAPLYVAGFPGGQDRAVAAESARSMGREGDLRVVDLDAGTLAAAVPEVARATGRRNPMDIAIALPLYLVAERAREDEFGRLALGQGADELFGGYEKVARAPGDPRVEAATVRGARDETVATLPAQLERDVRALGAAGVGVVAPLLHDRVVDAALRLPPELLVDERGGRKAGFRRVARSFVPDRVAFREKKAVQYGSLVARELDRLAREAGFKSREPNHLRRYVESRL
jgi:asparagine synthase (glutamine-hydrolysing)